MANKPSQNDQNVAAVEAIRNILFGEKEQYFEKRLSQLETALKNLEQQVNEQKRELENKLAEEKAVLEQQIRALETALNQKAGDLTKVLDETRQALENRLQELENRKADRQLLAAHFQEMAKTLTTSG